jgi:hypothetical protein
MSRDKMNAVQQHEIGGPEVLRYEDAPIPELKSGGILVRIHAVGSYMWATLRVISARNYLRSSGRILDDFGSKPPACTSPIEVRFMY